MKKILRFLFLLLLGRNGAQASSHIWNGSADTKWYNDSQTEFTITTPEQLAGLAKLVNNGNNFMRKTVKLGANIMLNDTANWRNWAKKTPKNKWKPIGFKKYTDGGHIGPIKLGNLIFNPFCGTFDGSGFAVSGVYVKSREGSQGLFGYFMGEIKNLGVVASYIEGSGDVGALVGMNEVGTISNSYSMALVVGHVCSGGLVGSNSNDSSKIINSYSASIVTGKNRAIGGLVGLNNGMISNSYFAGSVTGKKEVGGIAGIANGPMLNSYSTGSVSGDSLVGGMAGVVYRSNNVIIDSYYDKEASSQSDRGKGEGKSTAHMKQKSTYEDWDFDKVWGIDGAINDGYPYLRTMQQ